MRCSAHTTPLYDSPSPYTWGLSLIAFPHRPAPHPSGCGRRLGLSVLARGVSIHAWGLRLRGMAAHLRYRTPPCCLPGGETPSASRIPVFGAHLPSLYIPLSNASSAASRLPSHGSGPGWFATPFLYDSLIHCSTPVYPDVDRLIRRQFSSPARRSSSEMMATRRRSRRCSFRRVFSLPS
jgi:hypothetical protein